MKTILFSTSLLSVNQVTAWQLSSQAPQKAAADKQTDGQTPGSESVWLERTRALPYATHVSFLN